MTEVIIDYDRHGNVVGLEVLDAPTRMANPRGVEYAMTADEITEAYPYLDAEDVRQALNKLYSEESSRLDEDLAQMQWSSLPREDW